MSFPFNPFKKPRRNVALLAESPAEATPSCGLILVNYEIAATPPERCRLALFVGADARPAFDKPLTLSGGVHRHWLALHGHLLPNGPIALRLEVRRDDGDVLARRSLTVQVRNEGPVAEQVRASLQANGAALVVEGMCDSGDYDYADPALRAWFDGPPEAVEAHLQGLAQSGAATAEEIEALRHFVGQGYLMLPDVVGPEHLARLNAALDDAVARGVEGYEWGSSARLHNLHQDYPAIRELWLHPRILRMLDLIFEAPARPCQSLTYVFGSQQEHHQDTIHLTAFPAGRMCGVWTALEDVQPDSGELVVFPGSHRLPRVYMRDVGIAKVQDDWREFGATVVPLWTRLLNDNGMAPVVYQPKAGTVLIWHENLMHAGSVRRDLTKSRRSIVGHYFADGAVVYYDSSGAPAQLYQGARA